MPFVAKFSRGRVSSVLILISAGVIGLMAPNQARAVGSPSVCDPLRAQARTACCSVNSAPPAIPAGAGVGGVVLENFTYRNASGQMVSIPCRRVSARPPAVPGERVGFDPAAINVRAAPEFAACTNAQVALERNGCTVAQGAAAPNEELCGTAQQEAELPPVAAGQPGARAVAAPSCENLEAFRSMFPGGDITDPIRLGYLKAIYEGQPGLLPGGTDAMDDRDGRPAPQAGERNAPTSEDPRPAVSPAPGGMDAREVLPLRLEVPGNSLRYLMRSVGIEPFLRTLDNPQPAIDELNGQIQQLQQQAQNNNSAQVQQDLAKAVKDLEQLRLISDGVSCRSDLSCVINPWKSSAIREAFDQIESMVNAGGGGTLRITTEQAPAGNPEGFDLTAVKFTTNEVVAGNISAGWEGRFHIRPYRNHNLGFTFGPPSTFAIIPAHDPDRSNNYALTLSDLDRKGSYLDRAGLVRRISQPACQALQRLAPAGNELHKNPLFCSCGPNSTQNYCVFDPHVRPASQPELASTESLRQLEMRITGTRGAVELLDVSCSEPFAVNASLQETGQEREARRPVDYYFSGMSARGLSNLKFAIRQTGCFGTTAELFNMQAPRVSNGRTAGRYTASSVGLGLSMPGVGLGSVEIGIDRGLHAGGAVGNPAIGGEGLGKFVFDIDIFADAEKWLKKRWYTAWIGFLVDWIMKLLSGVVALVPNLILDSAQIVISPDGVYVDLGSVDLKLHSLFTGGKRDSDGQRHIGFGLRRMISSEKITAKAGFVDRINLPACDVKENWKQVSGPGDFLNFLWKTIAGCPMQAFTETLDLVITPLRELLFKDLLATLNDKLDSVAGKVVGDIGALAGDSFKKVAFDANRFFKRPSPLQGVAFKGSLPPFMQAMCASSKDPELSCFIMDVFTNPSLLNGDGEVGYLLDKVGAKTHFHSRDEFSANKLNHFHEPSVRSCVLGDNPTEDAAFNQTAEDLAFLTDFIEIDVSRRVLADGRSLPRSWKSQCALYVDFHVGGKVAIANSKKEVRIRPSYRTQALLNNAFTCRDSRDCNVSVANAQSPFYSRATLAMCSLTADIWARSATAGSAGPWYNVMANYNQADAEARARYRQDINSDFDSLLSQLAQLPGTSQHRQRVQAYQAVFNQQWTQTDQQGLTRVDRWFGMCLQQLTDAGFTIPRDYPELELPVNPGAIPTPGMTPAVQAEGGAGF